MFTRKLRFALFVIFIVGFCIAFFLLFRSEAIIVEKVAKKSLFLPPAYFVEVETEDDKLQRISKREMDELKKGDTIQGITIFDRFFTVHELPYKLLQLFIILLIVSVFIFGFVILSIKKYNDYFYSETGRKKLIQVLKVIGVAAVIFLLFVTNKFVINMIHKVVPVSQTETIAIVRDTQASGGGRYSDPTYELTLRFNDSSKEVHTVKKEVTRTTYKKHRKGSLIYITYRNQNPKDLFISRTSFKDVIGIGLYLEFIFYFLTLLFLIIYIRRMFKTRKETSI